MLVKNPEVPALPALPSFPPVKPRDEGSRTRRQALQTIFRGKAFLLLTTLLGLAIGVWIALSQPNAYRSVASLMVVGGGHEGLTPDLLRQSADGSRQIPLNLRGNAIEMLHDEALQRRIVAAAGARQILQPFAPRVARDQRNTLGGLSRRVVYAAQRWLSGAGQPVADDERAALETFQAGFFMDAPVATDVITVSYVANDPALARRVMQAVVVQTLARHVETYSHPGYVQLAQKHRDAALRRHEDAVKALEQHGRENGVDHFTLQLAQAERMASTAEAEAGTLLAGRGQSELQRLNKLAAGFERLQRDVATCATALAAAEQTLAVAEQSVELTKAGVSSLKVTQEPTLPLFREGPRRTRVLLGGLLGGLCLGLFLLLVRALTDPTVRGPEDLERPLGVKVLAMIPNLHRTHVRRHQSLRVTSWN